MNARMLMKAARGIARVRVARPAARAVRLLRATGTAAAASRPASASATATAAITTPTITAAATTTRTRRSSSTGRTSVRTRPTSGDRPTTLPADVGGPSTQGLHAGIHGAVPTGQQQPTHEPPIAASGAAADAPRRPRSLEEDPEQLLQQFLERHQGQHQRHDRRNRRDGELEHRLLRDRHDTHVLDDREAVAQVGQ